MNSRCNKSQVLLACFWTLPASNSVRSLWQVQRFRRRTLDPAFSPATILTALRYRRTSRSKDCSRNEVLIACQTASCYFRRPFPDASTRDWIVFFECYTSWALKKLSISSRPPTCLGIMGLCSVRPSPYPCRPFIKLPTLASYPCPATRPARFRQVGCAGERGWTSMKTSTK